MSVIRSLPTEYPVTSQVQRTGEERWGKMGSKVQFLKRARSCGGIPSRREPGDS